MKATGGSSRRRVLRVVLGLLGLAFFGLVLYVGGIDAWRQVLRANPLWIGVAFACTALLAYVSAARWGLILNAVAGRRIYSTRACYHFLVMGQAAGLVLPEALGNYAVGPLAMKAEGQSSFKLAFGTRVLDKSLDAGLSGPLLLPTALYALRLIRLEVCAIFFGLVFVLGAVALLAWYSPLVALAFRLRDWSAARARGVPLLRRFLDGPFGQQLLVLQTEQAPTRQVALAAYGMTVLRYGVMMARFAALAGAIGVTVPPLLVLVGIPIAQLGLLLAVTPGALGTLEAGWLGVLLLAGLSRQEIAAFLIGQRAALFVFVFVLGALSFLRSVAFPLRHKGRRATFDE